MLREAERVKALRTRRPGYTAAEGEAIDPRALAVNLLAYPGDVVESLPEMAQTVNTLLYDLPQNPRIQLGRRAVETLINAVRKAQSLGMTGMADVTGQYLSESPAEALEWGMGGLPMKTPRALSKGTIKLYHGSNSGSLDKVSDEGLFGGVFANSRPEAAESHITASGGVLHEIEIPEEKVLTQRALNYDLPFEEVRGALKKVASNNYLNVNDDTLDLLYSLIIEEKSVFDFVDDGKVLKALDMESFEDLGEASWKAQRLRGEVARDLGYQAVDTSDEHGTSYLVLPGSSIKSIVPGGGGAEGG